MDALEIAPTQPVSQTAPYPSLTREERDLSRIDLADRAAENALLATGATTPADWFEQNSDALMARVAERGWTLVRGLPVAGATQFRAAVARLGRPLIEDYGDLPMRPTDDGTAGVFNVTRYPAKKAILFHNEGSHTPCAPRFIFFHCAVPAAADGHTPLADSRAVLHALPVEIRAAFATHGLLYRRNFLPGLDVSWQEYFHTQNRVQVDEICAANGTLTRWHADGNLETETRRPAVTAHPNIGGDVFFNQILLHHPSCLDPEVRQAITNMPLQGRFPRDVRLGDGRAIPDEWVAEVQRAHLRNALCFRWQAGDIVMVDNRRVAHARRPYSGARQHHVVLAD